MRFYTYETTLGYFLEAAAKAGKPIVVLDRPNPITGAFVQGPVADAGRESFVSYWQTPVRHGMTMGELAQECSMPSAASTPTSPSSPCEGWQRGDWFDSTGAMWINPSPNMRSLTEATLYPGIGMIETTNISVGRGTDTPFEVVGAPWIVPADLARYLNARELARSTFHSHYVYARDASHLCRPEMRRSEHPRHRAATRSMLPKSASKSPRLCTRSIPISTRSPDIDTLMLNQAALEALTRGEDPRRIADDWRPALEQFQSLRAKYLLY